MKKQVWGTVLALTIGAGLGVAITVFNVTKGTEPQLGVPRAESLQAKDVQGEQSGDARLEALERQLAGLRQAVSQQRAENPPPSNEGAPSAAGDESAGELRSPEEVRKQQALWVQGHEHNLATHRSQARDVKWAPSMENSITESLEGLSADVKAKIDSVECRTASCAVTLVWDSEMDAKSELEVVSRAVGQLPCSTEIGLPLDPPADGPLELELYMGCERRAL